MHTMEMQAEDIKAKFMEYLEEIQTATTLPQISRLEKTFRGHFTELVRFDMNISRSVLFKAGTNYQSLPQNMPQKSSAETPIAETLLRHLHGTLARIVSECHRMLGRIEAFDSWETAKLYAGDYHVLLERLAETPVLYKKLDELRAVHDQDSGESFDVALYHLEHHGLIEFAGNNQVRLTDRARVIIGHKNFYCRDPEAQAHL